MAWPNISLNANREGDCNNFDSGHTVQLAQNQVQRSAHAMLLDYDLGKPEVARPAWPSTRDAVLDSQGMPSTNTDHFGWSMPSSTNPTNVVSTCFDAPVPHCGSNHSFGGIEGFFSHTASISPEDQFMDLPDRTPQGGTCNDEDYHRSPIARFHDRVQSAGKKTRNTKESQDPPLAQPIKCKWDGCRYRGTFKREALLIRHLKKIHFSPGAHPCCVPGCDMVCNRADNLTQHMRNIHR